MNDLQSLGLGELGQRVQAMGDPVADSRLRPYQGAPLPIGQASNGHPTPPYEPLPYEPLPYEPLEDLRSAPPLPPPVAAPGKQHLLNDPSPPKSGMQRAINAVRSTLPLVSKLLPLLDGNIVTAISALVAPQPSHHPPPPVQVDLEPVERGLAEVRNSHRELRNQVQEQVTSLKRVEDQLERVREATDRNTLEQQEMVEDLRAVGSRVGMLAAIGLVLLLASLGMNVWFLIQLQHILR